MTTADTAPPVPALYEQECPSCGGTGAYRNNIDGLHVEDMNCDECDGAGHFLVDEDGERVETDSHVAE